MDKTIDIHLKVTPSQKKTIDLRALENGFDDISSYIKVVALKTQAFILTPAGLSDEEASVEISFSVTKTQEEKILANMKESACEDLNRYLSYVALHGIVNAVVEVRSTGSLDAMLQRIADSRKSPRKLF